MDPGFYSNICEKLCNPECTINELNEIIQQFRTEINSERLVGKIHCLRDLVKTLERRDVINLENIEVIAGLLKRPVPFNQSLINDNDRYNCDYQFELIATGRPYVTERQGKWLHIDIENYKVHLCLHK